MSEHILVVKEEPTPKEWRGRRVTLVDSLLYMRQQLAQGRGLWFFTGSDSFDSLVAYIFGWNSARQYNREQEEDWQQFTQWLESKGHVPAGGWHAKMLRDAGGDHAKAVDRFLGLVAEFVATRSTEAQQEQ